MGPGELAGELTVLGVAVAWLAALSAAVIVGSLVAMLACSFFGGGAVRFTPFRAAWRATGPARPLSFRVGIQAAKEAACKAVTAETPEVRVLPYPSEGGRS